MSCPRKYKKMLENTFGVPRISQIISRGTTVDSHAKNIKKSKTGRWCESRAWLLHPSRAHLPKRPGQNKSQTSQPQRRNLTGMLTMPSKESWWALDHLEHWRRATEGALFTMSTFIMHNFDKLLVALHRTLFCIFQILSVYVMILHVNVCVCARAQLTASSTEILPTWVFHLCSQIPFKAYHKCLRTLLPFDNGHTSYMLAVVKVTCSQGSWQSKRLNKHE